MARWPVSTSPLRRLMRTLIVFAVLAAACASVPSGSADPEDTAVTSTTIAEELKERIEEATSSSTSSTSSTSSPDTTEAPDVDANIGEDAGAITLDDPYVGSFGNGGYDVQSYDLAIRWNQEAEQLDGVTTIAAIATQDLSSFNLDLYKLEVTSVEVDGAAAEFVRDGNELTIIPSTPIADGDDFVAIVDYGGEPQEEPGRLGSSAPSGWHTRPDSAYVLGEPVAASTFHPANDHPSDKARFTYRLTTSSDDLAIAGGNLLSETDNDDGTTTWVYEQDEPLATYLTTMMFGPFEIREDGTSESGIRVRNVFYSEIADEAEPIFVNQPQMIDEFEEMFGPYPFDLYGSAVVDDIVGGALETQTLSVFGRDVLQFGPFAERVVAHELAHQWFGNSVSVQNWEDLWLNEGFASYAEALWLERFDPEFTMQDWLDEASAQGPLLASQVHRPPEDQLFGAQVYIRGALTLHALRVDVGDDVFFEILQTWAARFRNKNASSAEFEALAEEISGMDLATFFDAWLRTDELPTTLEGFDPNTSQAQPALSLDQVRDLIDDYSECVVGEGSTYGPDPQTADPDDLIDEIIRLVEDEPAVHAACESIIESLAG